LNFRGNRFVTHFISLNTANNIGSEGAIKLSEALKVNTSLTWLDLYSNGLVASFHSHSIQIIKLVGAVKLSEALKLNTSLTYLNLRGNNFCFISFSPNADNSISREGGIKLSEVLKLNSSLASLSLRSNRFVASFHSHSI